MMARCRLGWDGIGSHSDNNREPAAEDLDWVEEPGPRPAIDWSSNNKHKVY